MTLEAEFLDALTTDEVDESDVCIGSQHGIGLGCADGTLNDSADILTGICILAKMPGSLSSIEVLLGQTEHKGVIALGIVFGNGDGAVLRRVAHATCGGTDELQA